MVFSGSKGGMIIHRLDYYGLHVVETTEIFILIFHLFVGPIYVFRSFDVDLFIYSYSFGFRYFKKGFTFAFRFSDILIFISNLFVIIFFS